MAAPLQFILLEASLRALVTQHITHTSVSHCISSMDLTKVASLRKNIGLEMQLMVVVGGGAR